MTLEDIHDGGMTYMTTRLQHPSSRTLRFFLTIQKIGLEIKREGMCQRFLATDNPRIHLHRGMTRQGMVE
jgi:hypothetical protein